MGLDEKKKNKIINISLSGIIAALTRWLAWRKVNKK